ncbi:MAG: hypothetical protein ABH889_00760 [Candidatus Portnoybacteria bacterium]
MSAVEVVVEIVKNNPAIRVLDFYPYAPKENVFEALNNPSISRLLFHDSAAGKEIRLKREEITTSNICEIISSLEKEYVLSVLSKVVLEKNNVSHIPLMDFFGKGFSGEPVEMSQNLADINHFLKEAGYVNGLILFSGRSFHYYGNYLMNEREWRSFLGDCLLSGLAEARYIGHREKDGYGVLRLSACSLRTHVPKVVAILDKKEV